MSENVKLYDREASTDQTQVSRKSNLKCCLHKSLPARLYWFCFPQPEESWNLRRWISTTHELLETPGLFCHTVDYSMWVMAGGGLLGRLLHVWSSKLWVKLWLIHGSRMLGCSSNAVEFNLESLTNQLNLGFLWCQLFKQNCVKKLF